MYIPPQPIGGCWGGGRLETAPRGGRWEILEPKWKLESCVDSRFLCYLSSLQIFKMRNHSNPTRLSESVEGFLFCFLSLFCFFPQHVLKPYKIVPSFFKYMALYWIFVFWVFKNRCHFLRVNKHIWAVWERSWISYISKVLDISVMEYIRLELKPQQCNVCDMIVW